MRGVTSEEDFLYGLPERQSRFADSDVAVAELRGVGVGGVSGVCVSGPSPRTRTFHRTFSVEFFRRFFLRYSSLNSDSSDLEQLIRTYTLRQATNKDGIRIFRRFVGGFDGVLCLNPNVGGTGP